MTQEKQVWFLTGSQNLYGPETLEQVAAQSKVVVEQLAKGLSADVALIWKPTLKTNEEIRQALSDATHDPNCVGVITWMHTFSPAKMWINGLDALRKPLLHLHTQAGQSLPWSTIDMDFMNLNQAAHGDREYAHILTRMSMARKIVVGHPTSQDVQSSVDAWAFAALGWNASQNLKLARFGDNLRYVAVTDGDKVAAQIDLGISVENLGVNTLCDAVDAVSDSAAQALAKTY